MAKTFHSDYYQDVRWQRKRLEILERDQFTCQKCQASGNDMLHVHHRHYLTTRMPWDYPSELLISLCSKCHKQEEDTREILRELVPALHFWGYFNTEIRDYVNKLIAARIPKKDKPNG